MAKLTAEQIAWESRNSGDADGATSLELSHRALSDVSCLISFQGLERLDLSYNCLSTLEDLASCVNLKWLSVVENKLESLKGVENLTKLTVLNAGKNKLQKMDDIQSVTSLRALILNDNNISSICKLDQLKYLNTLVLSRNPIYDIGVALQKAKSITKLSLSHCQIQNIGSSLTSCVELKEARLGHNNIITLSADLAQNIKLQNLDLGNNLIDNWSSLKVLSALKNLKNLNLQGNPIAGKDKLAKKVKKLVPNLRILNAKPIEKSEKQENFGLHKPSQSIDDLPLHDTTETDAAKKPKSKKPKLGDSVASNNKLAKLTKEDDLLPKSTYNEVEKETKRKKSKSKLEKNMTVDEVSEGYTNDSKLAKKLKRKTPMEKDKSKLEGIDDAETPFADLIFSDKASQKEGKNENDQQIDGKRLGALVIDHTKKKKKKANSVATGLSALHLLSRVQDIGIGGPSSWGD